MPRVPFAEENKVVSTNYDFPKLKLKKGEVARINAGLEDPYFEFIHNLRKPVVVDGVPVMTTGERRDGTTYETNKTTFVSSPICLGLEEKLLSDGADPVNCPVCKLAKTNPDYAQAPKRRYAMHVIKYRLKPGSGTPRVTDTFSVDLQVWSFPERIYNKLVDIKSEWSDLRQHDLILGPCENESYQKFDIAAAANAAWLESEERKKFTADTFRENQIPDLQVAVGSKKKLEWVEQDIEAIKEAWAEVNAATRGGDAGSSNLSEGLDNLLSGIGNNAAKAAAPAAAPVAEPAPVAAPAASTEDLLASFAPEEKAETTPAPAASDAPVDNFDDLLKGLTS